VVIQSCRDGNKNQSSPGSANLGVGKTPCEGTQQLRNFFRRRMCPDLQGKRVISLDMGALVAGRNSVADFRKNRLKAVFT